MMPRELMKTLLALGCSILMLSALASADRQDKNLERLDNSTAILNEIMAAPDSGIPSDIMNSAKCVAVVPSMKKGGFIIGASYGKGVATCRTATGWSAPAFFMMEGGSFGLQIGGQEVDLIMLVMNDRGMQALLSNHFKLGADATAAAGPVGRHTEAMTDWKMSAEVLSWSRTHGLFAGVSLNGATIRQNKDDTSAFYGKFVPFHTLLTGGEPAPEGAKSFLDTVNKYSPTPAKPEEAQTAQAQTSAKENETGDAAATQADQPEMANPENRSTEEPQDPSSNSKPSAGTNTPTTHPPTKTDTPPPHK